MLLRKPTLLQKANFVCAVVCAGGLVIGAFVGLYAGAALLFAFLGLANAWAVVA